MLTKMKIEFKHPLRTLLTGVLALLPLAATLLLLAWVLRLLSVWLGPGSAFGQLLTGIGIGLTESELVGYLVGLLLVIASVYGFGLLVERGLEQGAAKRISISTPQCQYRTFDQPPTHVETFVIPASARFLGEPPPKSA